MLVASHSRTEVVKDTLSESFELDQFDSYFYPVERSPRSPALARVIVGGGAYSIERRRNVDSAWMPIVTADVVEFDPGAFREWRKSWPVVANS